MIAHVNSQRLALGAQTQTNMLSRVIGHMSLRPGLRYVGGIGGNPDPRVDVVPTDSIPIILHMTGAGAATVAAAGMASIAIGLTGRPDGVAEGSVGIALGVTGVGST